MDGFVLMNDLVLAFEMIDLGAFWFNCGGLVSCDSLGHRSFDL